MRNMKLILLAAAPLVATALPAHAYIGPGAGAGAIAVVFGLIASVVMAFIAILWYPFKRMLRKKKAGPSLDGEASGRNETRGGD